MFWCRSGEGVAMNNGRVRPAVDGVSQVLSPEEVAERLQVSVDTLRYWRYSHCGPEFLQVRQVRPLLSGRC